MAERIMNDENCMELIEKIKAECEECYQNNVKYYGLALKILELIQENEGCTHQ